MKPPLPMSPGPAADLRKRMFPLLLLETCFISALPSLIVLYLNGFSSNFFWTDIFAYTILLGFLMAMAGWFVVLQPTKSVFDDESITVMCNRSFPYKKRVKFAAIAGFSLGVRTVRRGRFLFLSNILHEEIVLYNRQGDVLLRIGSDLYGWSELLHWFRSHFPEKKTDSTAYFQEQGFLTQRELDRKLAEEIADWRSKNLHR